MELLYGERRELDRQAVDFAAMRLDAAVGTSGQALLALPGGRSVTGLLEGLARTRLPWESVHFFLADERRVPVDSPDSNFREIDELLIAPLRETRSIPEEHLHPCRGGAAEYGKTFSRIGDSLDLLVLGAGEDGHIASLFPHRPELETRDLSFVDVADAPKPPPQRISASRALIERSAAVILLFYGESKREALRAFLDEDTNAADCPAVIARACADLLVLTDQPKN
jgi:6-phosphogluconolactonase